MEEKIEGIILGMRARAPAIEEGLFVTADRVIVAEAVFYELLDDIGSAGAKELLKLSPKEILKYHKINYAVPNSEITEVKLWRSWGSVKLRIKTSEKGSLKWICRGSTSKTAPKGGFEIEDYEAILRSVFGDKLSVKKSDAYMHALMASGWVFFLVAFLVNVYVLINGIHMEVVGLHYYIPPFYAFEGYVAVFVVSLIGGLIINHREKWGIVGVPWIIGAALMLTLFLYYFWFYSYFY